MKRVMFLAALAASSVAVAQTAESPTAGAQDPAATQQPTDAPDADAGTADPATGQTTSTGTSATTGGSAIEAGNSAPERDARGIAVRSDAAMAPSGANQPAPAGGGQFVPAPNQASVFAVQPSSREYKACTRTVTDGCVQTYERGRAKN